jgi:hypothetical protein
VEDVSGFILNVVGMTRFWFVCLNGETFFQKKRFCFILETLNLRRSTMWFRINLIILDRVKQQWFWVMILLLWWLIVV